MKLEKPPIKDVQPDLHCPFYSGLAIRQKTAEGTVVSKTADNLTATVQIERKVFVQKYKRYKKAYSKVTCHNPAVLNAQVGDVVQFVGCRPISKTKSNVIIKIL